MVIKRNLLQYLEGVKDFSEFEKKLSKIPEDKIKGDLFELFCQAYLTVIHPQNFKSVRLFNHPENSPILERLNLRINKDYGIDLIAITDSDEIWTIQSKFRSSNLLTWRELSTFRDSSRKADFMLVMGNINQVLHPFKNIEKFSSILRLDFQRLDENDFMRLRNYLGSKEEIIKFSPRPHQKATINKALKHFSKHDKGQMIHACGTGKTLSSLWIKEKLKPKNTIVFVPSLSLLKQTLEEWFKHKNNKFSLKCVCSDPSVTGGTDDSDEPIIDLTELGVPVTTKEKDIKDFLLNEDEKIIFSTYQSAEAVLKAVREIDNFSFDFGVFDEAHRTATKGNGQFSNCLNISIKKKLFMTATPKIYLPHLKKLAKQEDIELCSMDDEERYGKVFDKITFGKAIRLNLLSDYKIKIIVVSDEDIKELIDRRYWLNVNNKEITADELAKIWALIQAMKQVNHVISFHSRVNSAKMFRDNLNEAIALLKEKGLKVSEIDSFHISGKYPAYQRSSILREFIQKNKSLVTNARCLTEGVDVPAIDGVYFVDPKNNLIDIVQATGRAIRKKKDSKFGYVIVPIFVADEKNIDAVISSSAFDQVWRIIQAMKSQDEVLSAVIDKLRMFEGLKKKSGSLRSRDLNEYRKLRQELSNKFEFDAILPKKFDFEKFIDKVNLKTIELTGNLWNEWFLKLVKFREENNNKWPIRKGEELVLARWCSGQRHKYKKNELSKEHIKKLQSIGFQWVADKSDFKTWLQHYNNIIEFRKNNPKKWPSFGRGQPKDEEYLGTWVAQQRQKRKRGILHKEREELLKKIDFEFEPMGKTKEKWMEDYYNVLSYKEKKRIWPRYLNPKSYALKTGLSEEEYRLGCWCYRQRYDYKNKNLPKDKLQLLNKVNFDWMETKISNYNDKSWNKKYNQLTEYRKKNPKKWPQPYNEDEKELHNFVKGQKRQFVKGALTPDRINKLKKINFPLQPRKYGSKKVASKSE